MESGFFAKIYDIVAKIPAGYVATYGQIAFLAGHPRAARQVGYAMRAAPAERNLPCHRVVNRFGEMAPEHVFGDRAIQRMLLEGEGVVFAEDGRINFEISQWDGKWL